MYKAQDNHDNIIYSILYNYVRYIPPNNHETLTQCWFNISPALAPNIKQTLCFLRMYWYSHNLYIKPQLFFSRIISYTEFPFKVYILFYYFCRLSIKHVNMVKESYLAIRLLEAYKYKYNK